MGADRAHHAFAATDRPSPTMDMREVPTELLYGVGRLPVLYATEGPASASTVQRYFYDRRKVGCGGKSLGL